MKEIINDWEPETKSLIARLSAAGCEIVRGDNGEESFDYPNPSTVDLLDRIQHFVEKLVACDEAHLYVRTPLRKTPKWLYLVLGNSPGELVNDFVVDAVIEKVTQAHYEEWCLKGQPKKYRE